MVDVYHAMPILPSRQVERSVAFYSEVLNFKLQRVFRDGDESPFFAILRRDLVTIGLQAMEHFTPHKGTVVYIYVENAQAISAGIQGSGGILLHQPYETFYGMLEFDLMDPDGHVIAFGQDLNPGPPGPGL